MKSFVLTMDPPGIEVRGDILLMFKYHFLPTTDDRMRATLAAIEKFLAVDTPHGMRYIKEQGIDRTCHFGWSLMYLTVLHEFPERRDYAITVFESVRKEVYLQYLIESRHLLTTTTTLLLQLIAIGDKYQSIYSEKFDPVTGEMWGNYPHISAIAGVIECAVLFSRKWTSVV